MHAASAAAGISGSESAPAVVPLGRVNRSGQKSRPLSTARAKPVAPDRFYPESMAVGHLSEELRRTVHAASAPYGYTLTIWASGTMTVHERPQSLAVLTLLFATGAIAGFILVARVAAGTEGVSVVPAPYQPIRPLPVIGVAHVIACGLAIGACEVVLVLVPGALAGLLAGFAATFLYVVVCAVELATARRVLGAQ